VVFFLLVLGLLRQRGIFRIFSIGFGTVATACYFLYFFYWNHAVATVPNPIEKNTKNTTLSQQFKNQYILTHL
jgi:hypothetical protein